RDTPRTTRASRGLGDSFLSGSGRGGWIPCDPGAGHLLHNYSRLSGGWRVGKSRVCGLGRGGRVRRENPRRSPSLRRQPWTAVPPAWESLTTALRLYPLGGWSPNAVKTPQSDHSPSPPPPHLCLTSCATPSRVSATCFRKIPFMATPVL